MQCLICGKILRALGSHLGRKHLISGDEYKDRFKLLRSTPLADADIVARWSAGMLERTANPKDKAYRPILQERMRIFGTSKEGHTGFMLVGKGSAAHIKVNAGRDAYWDKIRADAVEAMLQDWIRGVPKLTLHQKYGYSRKFIHRLDRDKWLPPR
jgi:hypothetical protein